MAQRELITVSVPVVIRQTTVAGVGNLSNPGAIIDHCCGTRLPLLKVYQTPIPDVNHSGKTNHRLEVLQNTSADALPG